MKVIAKCTNYSGCLLAYKGEKVELAEGAPLVCPECGKALAVDKGSSQTAMVIAAIAAALLLLGAGGFFVVKKILGKPQAVPEQAGEVLTETSEMPETSPTPEPDPVTPPVPPTPSGTTDPAPAVADAAPAGPPKADNTPVTEDVRAEVLKRIDAMPNIAPEKKDKLYNSVRRAREMRRIVVVPFASGARTLPAGDQANVKNILNSAEIMKFRDDLTAVFVVLGFADSKGDDKSNLVISGERAKNVKDFMVNQCGVKNVTHDVAMGSSTLVDERRLEKNRIVEIWTVLP